MMEDFLEVCNVTKRFSGHTALEGASLTARRGRVFGLLGPNGAGKTTMLRIINRIFMPDSGEVHIDGRLMTDDDVRRIGYLPEERGLYRKMKVGEQALYLARLKGLDRHTAEQRLARWFEKFDIARWRNKKLEELSKGMQQKVQFVITVLHEPELLVFDEPFSGFDPVNAELLKREILALKDEGRTIIFSTHNMSSVEEVCDDIALINRSHVVLDGEVGAVRAQFRTGLYEAAVDESTPLPDNGKTFHSLSVEKKGGMLRYSLQKNESASNAELLAELNQAADVRLFAEQLPTMNDIFLQTVGGAAVGDRQKAETK